MEKSAGDDPSADGLRARGIAALVIGDVNRGVAALEEAAGKRPSDARIQSDLSAAYLAGAGGNSQSEDLSKALAAANRAVNANRTLPEALFNRAFALERLSMTQDAREAWQAYLTIDDRTGWADEARLHVRALGGQR
jgi:Flp pilus assembly protein TadD